MNNQQPASELDFGLGLSSSEAECQEAIAASFEPMPEPVEDGEPENSIYNFSKLLDTV